MRTVHLMFLFLSWWMGVAFAMPSVKVSYQVYTINSLSKTSLLSDLKHASPIKKKKKVYHGKTKTQVVWTYKLKKISSRCHLKAISTHVNILYTLPKLIHHQKNKALHALWNQWYSALFKHEKQHAAHAIKTAYGIETAINALLPSSSCRKLKRKISRIGKKYTKILKKLDKQYDKKTKHGRTEGARLSDYL